MVVWGLEPGEDDEEGRWFGMRWIEDLDWFDNLDRNDLTILDGERLELGLGVFRPEW